MKKIILLLLVLFSLNIKVQASTRDVYYSEYSDFSEFSEVQINSSELIDVESERRYRWYKNNITSEYLLYDDGINKYEFVDMNNYEESEFSDWQYEIPNSITGRTIEEKEEYRIKKLKPIQSLLIGGFSFNKDMVDLGQIEIYVNNHKIDYQYIFGDCIGTKFKQSGFIMIDFYEAYYIKDITIKFINPDKEYINSFKIYATELMQSNVPSKIYASYTYQNDEADNIVINEENFNIVNPEYEEEIIVDELPDISTLDYVEVNNKYRYKDKYYYFYNSKREYIDGYYSDYSEYIRDENDYKDYYRYRTREKIVIENELTITRYKENLEDFVISTVDYDIETDINYLKNGLYSVRYITPFQTITKEVTVDIEENDLRKDLEELSKEYESLTDKYNSSQNQLKELEKINIINKEQLSSNNINYQNLLNDYIMLTEEYESLDVEDNLGYINSLKEEKQKCSNDLTSIKLKNDDYEKKLKLSNQANDYLEKSLLDIKQESVTVDKTDIIPFVLLGLFIILFIIILVKKLSIKN